MATPVPRSGTGYRVTILFNQGAIGWSSTFYFVASGDSFENVVTAAGNLGSTLRTCLSRASYIPAIRVTEVGGFSPSKLISGQETPKTDGFTGGAEYPSKGWLVSMAEATNTYRRKGFIRGIIAADNTYTPDNQFKPAMRDSFGGAFAEVRKILTNDAGAAMSTVGLGHWCIRAWDRSSPTRQEINISNLTINESTKTWQFTVTTAGGLTQGKPARIKGIKGPSTEGVNGPFRVLGITGTAPNITIITNKTQRCPFTPVVKDPGIMIVSEKRFYDIAKVTGDRIVTRKTGRAFFVPAGRAKGIKC